MIKWKSIQNKEGEFNYSRHISTDGRFEITSQGDQWYLYDEKSPDKRWYRRTEKTLIEAQNDAEWIVEEERNGRNPY